MKENYITVDYLLYFNLTSPYCTELYSLLTTNTEEQADTSSAHQINIFYMYNK